jgi:glycosyltransferase involved in cell wall biosynthesis
VSSPRRRLLVISHPCVVDVNQSVYLELRNRGWEVQIVVPSRWRHEHAAELIQPKALEGLEDALMPLPVVPVGSTQRHVYLARPSRVIRSFRPDVMFIEQESFSVPALQWAVAARRARVPFGVQSAENLDRPFPLPARVIRRWVLSRTSFIAARSPAAARLVRAWGATGTVGLVPHAVPMWPAPPAAEVDAQRPFTVGYAGRLVPEKGIDDLLAALRRLDPPVRLLVAGAGPLLGRVESEHRNGMEVELLQGVAHGEMRDVFRRMDVLAVPSRTTRTWAEQFGRVLVEAMSQRVPVVGSDSGEIPWVIEVTGGGITFPEADSARLADALEQLRRDHALRAELGERGVESVERLFSVTAAADQLEALLTKVAR